MIARRMDRQTGFGFWEGVRKPTVAGLLGSFCIFRCLYPEHRGHEASPPAGSLATDSTPRGVETATPKAPPGRSRQRSKRAGRK
jgi:hypothetical protein